LAWLTIWTRGTSVASWTPLTRIALEALVARCSYRSRTPYCTRLATDTRLTDVALTTYQSTPSTSSLDTHTKQF